MVAAVAGVALRSACAEFTLRDSGPTGDGRQRLRDWVENISAPEWTAWPPYPAASRLSASNAPAPPSQDWQDLHRVSYAIASLGSSQASAEQFSPLLRKLWEIESRVYHLRDFNYDEDRRRMYVPLHGSS